MTALNDSGPRKGQRSGTHSSNQAFKGMNLATLDVLKFAKVLESGLQQSNRRVRAPSTFDLPVYWPGGDPDFFGLAGYDVALATPATIREEVEEELRMIRATLDHLNFDYQLSKTFTDHGATREFATQLARHNLSILIWTSVCVPIRRQGEFLYRVWMLDGVTGKPIVRILHVDAYISCVSRSVVEDQALYSQNRKKVDRLELACAILGVACIGLLVAIL